MWEPRREDACEGKCIAEVVLRCSNWNAPTKLYVVGQDVEITVGRLGIAG